MWVAILADSVAALEFPVLLGSLIDIKEVARLRIETATLAIDHGEALSQIALQPGSVMAKGNGGKREARAFDGRRVVLTVLAVDDPVDISRKSGPNQAAQVEPNQTDRATCNRPSS
jgi:hypothetical protein